MTEEYFGIFMFSIVLTSIGLFCTALCISDAFIRSYYARKQQLLPRYCRAKEILKVRNLLTVEKFTPEIKCENPRPLFCKPPFDWS